MIIVLNWAIGGILLFLSAVHWYWVAGGRRGTQAAVPSDGSTKLFRPSKLATGVVAGLLLMAAWFVLEFGGAVEQLVFPKWLLTYGRWGLSAVFILRAIGDFRWIGFFKKRKGTLFAQWDTILYSPLCLCIGIGLLAIAQA
ncbi:DUF3995 domain-containing protein [Paenibacillus nanensis]|uniref:DUF3995 domain-containing protein n=1 Tax=Paenibacillus nanensis TaxID=393251 RepID=A0A3A1VHZ6_9BACL|nr:DUF3995 domain-containing protein [Paenibacillus nanensis]RIX60061.1 DUF3995 domain-containing protein [Paenibacillus nanensis]